MNWKTMDLKADGPWLGRKRGEIIEGGEFPCSLCAGSGILPRTKGTQCPKCLGKGVISINGPVVVCAYCKGRGKVPIRTNLSCTVCGGKGLVSVSREIEECSHCRGTGAEPSNKLPCLQCRGKGVVEKKTRP
jgi:DnaJ-class molecular chaperone